MFWKSRIYLDYAASPTGNPSSPHEEGRAAKKILEDARVAIARLTEVKPDDIVFTSGATEANALAIFGLAKRGDHVLYLPSSHASIVENVKLLEERGVETQPMPIAYGRVDIDALKKMVRPTTVLATMDAVCGETGTIWNTREVRNVLSSDAYLHVDASQAPLTEKISRSHFGADLVTFDGAKLGAPGAGCLIAHRTIPLTPLYGGGGQERELRSGTENVEALAKFAAALGAAAKERGGFKARAAAARAHLLPLLEPIKELYINVGAEGVPNILNLSLSGRDTDYLVALLDEAGFAVSTRSACETNSEEGSRAVFALTGDKARAASTLRVSWGPDTRPADLERFAAALARSVRFIDSAS